MKKRNGFVSNSSSVSFALYVWSADELSETLAMPPEEMWFGHGWDKQGVLEGQFEEGADAYAISQYLSDLSSNNPDLPFKAFDVHCANMPDGEEIAGVGQYETDIDHYDDNWRDFEFDYPDDKVFAWLSDFASRVGLPAPRGFKATFRDG